jgi:ABC-type lipoprotein release transport system permease subunit
MVYKSLRYYWRIHLAVIAGAAIATAVLTGALLVGDSVRGSLQEIILQRLGRIEYAMVSEKFFREQLSPDLEKNSTFQKEFTAAVPAITLSATAVQPETGSRASNITVHGIDQRLNALFDKHFTITQMLARQQGQIFPSVVVTESLRRELGLKTGSVILISFQKPGDIHPETVLGERDVSNTVRKIRLTVTGVVPEKGPGGLTLRPHQTSPQNAFVDLKVIQRSLELSQKANTLYVSAKPQSTEKALRDAFKEVFHIDDAGLKVRSGGGDELVVETSEIILNPALVKKTQQMSESLGAKSQQVFTYLANKIQTNNRTIPYSTITAVSDPDFELQDGSRISSLKDNEILLNRWAADDLKAQVGDQIHIEYYAIASGNQLITQSKDFRLAGIVAMKGYAVDSSLSPEYPGIQDTDDISDWSPPFPVDLNLIRPVDEEYWDLYRAAPKAFVSLNEAQRLWSSRFGNLTSIRISKSERTTEENIRTNLAKTVDGSDVGMMFQPVKQQGLQAASGSSDFGALFTGFSFFLILSAAMLAGLLFRLGAEQRSAELGTLLAMGYTPRSIQRRLLMEGTILALVGVLLGCLTASAYAWLMLTGLRTWWQSAVGSSDLQLHATTGTLLLGAFISLIAMLFSLWWSIRRLSKIAVPALLAGSTTSFEELRPSRLSRIVAILSLLLGLGFVVIAFYSDASLASAMFFAAGACLLISALAFLMIWLRKAQHRKLHSSGGAAAASMAARNTSRNPGRSLLSAALVSCACFVILAVGMNRRELRLDPNDLKSGTGGYSLLAQSSIPLLYDPSNPKGRKDLGLSEDLFKQTTITSFRLLPGEDASCLNLYRPEKPRILGVPQQQVDRGGFQFQQSIASNPKDSWKLLNQDLGENVIPAIGDYNSVLWILHSGLGKELQITDSAGNPLRLRFVALLKGSVFQSEILISEKQFTKHFPKEVGYSYFLIHSSSTKTADFATNIEEQLADYGVDTKSTVETIENYHAVENTYLSTFQTLGGLGLLLGTTGLGIILWRNVLERRGELATMRAFGFQRKFLATMVVAENAFLLCVGIITGTITAAITATPFLLQDLSNVPWLSLLLTLLLVFFVGMISSLAAVSAILRVPLLPALKAE